MSAPQLYCPTCAEHTALIDTGRCPAALVRCGLGVCLVAERACVEAQVDLWSAAA